MRSRSEIEKQALSIRDVAQFLGLSLSGTNALFHSQGFPAFRIGKRLLVTRAAFEAWLDEQQQKVI